MQDHRVDFAGRQAQQSLEIIGNGKELELGMGALQILMGSEVLADRDPPQPPHSPSRVSLSQVPWRTTMRMGMRTYGSEKTRYSMRSGKSWSTRSPDPPFPAHVLEHLADGGGRSLAKPDAQLSLQQPDIVRGDATEPPRR